MIFDVIVFPLAAFVLFRDLSHKNPWLNHTIVDKRAKLDEIPKNLYWVKGSGWRSTDKRQSETTTVLEKIFFRYSSLFFAKWCCGWFIDPAENNKPVGGPNDTFLKRWKTHEVKPPSGAIEQQAERSDWHIFDLWKSLLTSDHLQAVKAFAEALFGFL